jgi:phosphoglycolate phosphatase
MSQIKALLFDLDGTLIDSVTDLANSVNHTLATVGLPPHTREEIKSFVGDGVQKLIKRSLGKTHQEKFTNAFNIFMAHYEDHCTDNTVLYPGTAQVLPDLAKDYSLAVLTNKSERFTHKILKALEIDQYFNYVLGGDSLATKKPDPAGILFLAEQWQLDPGKEILMVGDHATDIEVGQKAGCRTVFIDGGIGVTRGLAPDFTIGSIAELPDLLKTLG